MLQKSKPFYVGSTPTMCMDYQEDSLQNKIREVKIMYKITNIKQLNNTYQYLVTLTDSQATLSDIIREIKLEDTGAHVMVDAGVVTGFDVYRFVSAKVNENNELDFTSSRQVYVNPTMDVKEIANRVVQEELGKYSNDNVYQATYQTY